uniref:Uncharacterized protein n=1 Tax=Triticum urartu TaxID=4572 RepID=A0A8R7V743_TRIUA
MLVFLTSGHSRIGCFLKPLAEHQIHISILSLLLSGFSHTQSCRSDRSLVTAACQEEATSFSYKCSDFSDGS